MAGVSIRKVKSTVTRWASKCSPFLPPSRTQVCFSSPPFDVCMCGPQLLLLFFFSLFPLCTFSCVFSVPADVLSHLLSPWPPHHRVSQCCARASSHLRVGFLCFFRLPFPSSSLFLKSLLTNHLYTHSKTRLQKARVMPTCSVFPLFMLLSDPLPIYI